MIHDNKPALEEALEHHGVKGQRWGVRKARSFTSSSNPNAPRNKKILKVSASVLAVAGAAVAVHILAAHGVSSSSVRSVTSSSFKPSSLSHDVWKTQVSSLSKDIADANKAQDAFMRSIGLGSKNGVIDTAAFTKFLQKSA